MDEIKQITLIHGTDFCSFQIQTFTSSSIVITSRSQTCPSIEPRIKSSISKFELIDMNINNADIGQVIKLQLDSTVTTPCEITLSGNFLTENYQRLISVSQKYTQNVTFIPAKLQVYIEYTDVTTFCYQVTSTACSQTGYYFIDDDFIVNNYHSFAHNDENNVTIYLTEYVISSGNPSDAISFDLFFKAGKFLDIKPFPTIQEKLPVDYLLSQQNSQEYSSKSFNFASIKVGFYHDQSENQYISMASGSYKFEKCELQYGNQY
jgi:hypothetical protein